ncbi:hypothetical protein Taro_026751 [Colocasia esculenta]|uniref:Uncharacterized protein n=1 Tax=Colocasia esculenta TaxID=4460 RepID=A0A843VLI9_COLES|nr:hypothetical protein [Colocasia esculenta]
MPHFRKLGPESLKVSDMELQQCELQLWCCLFVYSVEVERQLDLSSLAARLSGRPVLLVQVRESRRFHTRLLVQSRIVAVLGPCLQ